MARLIDDSSAKIIDFWPQGAFTHGKDSKKISEDGKQARLIYALIGFAYPKVELKISDTSKVVISGSHDLEPFTLDVK